MIPAASSSAARLRRIKMASDDEFLRELRAQLQGMVDIIERHLGKKSVPTLPTPGSKPDKGNPPGQKEMASDEDLSESP
jgi:hypothetical protein